MKKISTVGVVGAGTMGSGLAQKFSQEGFEVILADRSIEFVNKGLAGIKKVLNEGLEKKVFTQGQVEEYLLNIKGTDSLEDLADCDIVIEAIFEDFKAKEDLFKQLCEIVPDDTILATNTSSFSVSELASAITNPARFIGVHYFYHAAKNRLVEIIPGSKTSSETTRAVYRFAIQSGKDPIFTEDAYGFAINRFFVPWLNEACRLLHEEKGSIGMIDAVCMKTFGIGMGPFALMNATGVPIAMHSQKTLEIYGPAYKVSSLLEHKAESKTNWEINGSETVPTEQDVKEINERMLGCTFFVCSQILEEDVCSATDLNKGAKIGLKWRKGPVDLMLQYGETEVKRLVANYVDLYQESLPDGIQKKYWELEFVSYSKMKNRATITMNRPEDLNALNEDVMKQLDLQFSKAEEDPDIDTIFITGSGKAFIAGADIRFFVKNMKSHTISNIVNFTKYGQTVFEKIDKSQKKVIALLNGLALGGGLELALCADHIFALSKVNLAFPETGIGIYPGLGGTQRTSLRIGKGLAKYLVLTGKSLSAKEAEEIGLLDKVISSDEYFEILEGGKLPELSKKTCSGKWLAYADFYQKNKLDSIFEGNYELAGLEKEELEKLRKSMSFKAPVAMHFAEELIDNARGPASELEKLTAVFSTEDAMAGLSSIGQKVTYQGK
ncbi:MAG: 3-hydroxyacyl-CoA dehydrogenase NAD-binding domain-containing protein [bacterium]|nr:3-hydroxyacyl-CoA dehydrogenase NAD-binding domain-containing protein [bacterium]